MANNNLLLKAFIEVSGVDIINAILNLDLVIFKDWLKTYNDIHLQISINIVLEKDSSLKLKKNDLDYVCLGLIKIFMQKSLPKKFEAVLKDKLDFIENKIKMFANEELVEFGLGSQSFDAVLPLISYWLLNLDNDWYEKICKKHDELKKFSENNLLLYLLLSMGIFSENIFMLMLYLGSSDNAQFNKFLITEAIINKKLLIIDRFFAQQSTSSMWDKCSTMYKEYLFDGFVENYLRAIEKNDLVSASDYSLLNQIKFDILRSVRSVQEFFDKSQIHTKIYSAFLFLENIKEINTINHDYIKLYKIIVQIDETEPSYSRDCHTDSREKLRKYLEQKLKIVIN